jgi:hypothetical protein
MAEKTGKIQTRRWWALLRGPSELPVIFQTRQQALDNRDPDEYLVPVIVQGTHAEHRIEPPSWTVPGLKRRQKSWKK